MEPKQVQKKPRRSSILKCVNPSSQELPGGVMDIDLTCTTTRLARRVSFAEMRVVKNFDKEDGQCHSPKQEPALMDSINSVGSVPMQISTTEHTIQSSKMSLVAESEIDELGTQSMVISQEQSTVHMEKRSRISMAAMHDSVIAGPNNGDDWNDQTDNILQALCAASSTPMTETYRVPMRPPPISNHNGIPPISSGDNEHVIDNKTVYDGLDMERDDVVAESNGTDMSLDSQGDCDKSVNVKNIWVKNNATQDVDMEMTEEVNEILMDETMKSMGGPDKTSNFLAQLADNFGGKEDTSLSVLRANTFNKSELMDGATNLVENVSELLDKTKQNVEDMVFSQPETCVQMGTTFEVKDTLTPHKKHVIHEEDLHLHTEHIKPVVKEQANESIINEMNQSVADLRKRLRRSMEVEFMNSPRKVVHDESGILEETSLLLVNRTETLPTNVFPQSPSLPPFSSSSNGSTTKPTMNEISNSVTGEDECDDGTNDVTYVDQSTFSQDLYLATILKPIQDESSFVENMRKDIMQEGKERLKSAVQLLENQLEVQVLDLKRTDPTTANRFLDGNLHQRNASMRELWEVNRLDAEREMFKFQAKLTKTLVNQVKETADELKSRNAVMKEQFELVEQLATLQSEADKIPHSVTKNDVMQFDLSKEKLEKTEKELKLLEKENRNLVLEIAQKASNLTKSQLKIANGARAKTLKEFKEIKRKDPQIHMKFAPFSVTDESTPNPKLQCWKLMWELKYSTKETLKAIKPNYIIGVHDSSPLFDSKHTPLVDMIKRENSNSLNNWIDKYKKRSSFVQICQELLCLTFGLRSFSENEIFAACRLDPDVLIACVAPFRLSFTLHLSKLELGDIFMAELIVEVDFNMDMQYTLKLVHFDVVEGNCKFRKADIEQWIGQCMDNNKPLLSFFKKIQAIVDN